MLYCCRIQGPTVPPDYLILNKLAGHQKTGWGHRRDTMAIAVKNVVIPLEVEYLQAAAKERGISRSKLVRVLMEKVVREKLVSVILNDDDLVEPRQQRYRRFRDSR
jgi:hypothetical protein